MCFFFFKQKTAYEMRISDWSSDVCSSDLDRRTRSRTSRPDSRPGAASHPAFPDGAGGTHTDLGGAEPAAAAVRRVPGPLRASRYHAGSRPTPDYRPPHRRAAGGGATVTFQGNERRLAPHRPILDPVDPLVLSMEDD